MRAPPLVALSAICALEAAAPAARAQADDERAERALHGDPSPKVRAEAAFLLARRGDREAVPALERALAEDEAVAVRLAAATALGRLGALRSAAPLRDAAARDPDPAVRESARVALGQILRGARTVAIEPVEGGRVDARMREQMRQALSAELERHGFAVVRQGEETGYRLRPTVLLLEEGHDGAGLHVEVKTSLIAIDTRGDLVAMVEGGARAESETPTTSEKLAGQAFAAAARSLSEDLAKRLQIR
ncbi:MAG TPA: HEAT repeat domain-containing protein [Anaeromyxobacteraceae bacterium]|nr:HEAT repeat domain-containing protein [Anaeromyxobacteraceae bacterium]